MFMLLMRISETQSLTYYIASLHSNARSNSAENGIQNFIGLEFHIVEISLCNLHAAFCCEMMIVFGKTIRITFSTDGERFVL